MRRSVDRIGPGDLTELATDVGPVPMNVGAVLVLDGGSGVGAAEVEAALAGRIAAVPRLRQRLVTPPWGLGRPYWVDDPGVDLDARVSRVRCPGAGDDDVLRVAVDAVTRPLPRTRPLWRAVVITGLSDGRVALVLVLHHVLADGIGGLAVLARLVDEGAGTVRPAGAPRPAPSAVDLLVDSAQDRLRVLRLGPSAVAQLGRGRAELGSARRRRAPRCSLNVPTGPRRQVATVDVALDPLQAAGRRHGATVNDVLLVALTAAMARTLHRRGEQVEELVVSVPVSARVTTTSGDLGNRVGVMPVPVPVTGTLHERLAEVARRTRAQKTQARGASAALVGPAFRALAAARLFRWLIDRQRLVNSFLTNLRGPAAQLSLAGAPILRVVPITVTAGNVGVAFAALSYAGRLTLTVIADPDVLPDPGTMAADLRTELQRIVAETPASGVGSGQGSS
jgi:WS/DGAT/MGAT family acyltransferase